MIVYDLCIDCIYAEFFWLATIKRFGYIKKIVRYEIGKRCSAKKTNEMFRWGKGKIHQQRVSIRKFGFTLKSARFIDYPVKRCGYFMNNTLFGFRPYPNNLKEVINNMPKLASKITDVQPPEEGCYYKIDDTEIVKAGEKQYPALRVNMTQTDKEGKPIKKDGKDVKSNTLCWLGEKDADVGVKSKLGCFYDAFDKEFKGTDNDYNDTDNWHGYIIKVISWKAKNRQITVISEA